VRALLVTDNRELGQELAQSLNGQGFDTVFGVADGMALQQRSLEDIVLLDLSGLKSDGFLLCQHIRTHSSVPIILLSDRNDEFDLVLGLKVGADDFIARPYRLRELVARIEAVVRRAQDAWPKQSPRPVCRHGILRIDPDMRQVWAADCEVSLTPKEFDLLSLLVSDSSHIFSRVQIMSVLWGYGSSDDTRTLDVHMANLRRKLRGHVRIATIRGIGFRMEASR
jgi:two-component system, OmpR family, response regulator RegX3